MATPVSATLEESHWVQQAQAGDSSAFEALVRAHHEPVFRLVLSIVRQEHEAHEVCQDVWVTVWQQLARFRGEAKFSTWLHSIAVRRAIDQLRRRRRWFNRFLPFQDHAESDGERSYDSAPEPVDPGPDGRLQLEHSERDARFERVLAALPPHHRTVLVLREVQGLSYDEIATLTHCRPGTVMSRLFHARRQLARKLKDLPCDSSSS